MIGLVSRWTAALAVCALAACGGGGGGEAGTPILGGANPAPQAADLVLVLSAASVANSGAESVVATVTAIDANRNALSGIPVTVSVNANGVVTPSGTRTNAQGVVTAGIGIGSDRSERTIVVSATSGAITRTAALQVREVGGGSGAVASDLILTLSAANVPNSGTQTVTATAVALDAKRNTLSGVDVTLSVDANAALTPSGATTNETGAVTGVIGIGSDRSNRTITVTARSGSIVRTALLPVVDAVVVGPPTASDLSLVLSAPKLNNGGTSTITATAVAVDANRNALAGIPVTIKVDNSAVVTVSGSTTDTQGRVTGTVGIGADRSNRVVTVTASSGTLVRSSSFVVDGAELRASLAPRVNAGSTGNSIEYTLVDTNALPMAGQSVSVTAPGLPSASGTTDVNGKYTYTYTAPATSVTFTATAAGATRVSTVEVGSGVIDPAPAVPQSASVTASPSVISVNSVGSTTNQVELRALFYGGNNQPIPRVRVRFDLDGNSNSTDGVVAWLGGDYAYSDANGVARATFTPGQRSSPTNGVTVRICYDVTDFPTTSCPNRSTTTLTVVQEALAVSIRTNELIKEGAAKLTYIKEFVVMVVDSAGQAKADILITPSIDLPAYYKGYFVWNGTLSRWVQVMTLDNAENYQWDATARRWNVVAAATPPQPMCPQEDANRNGVREAPAYTATAPALALREEDLNWNGSLDARKSDVAIKMVGSSKTDANGLAIVQIEYGKDVATWVDYVITITASGIAGTEARATYSGLRYGLGNLPAPGEAVTDEFAAPAFVVSPYGRATQCTSPN